MATWRFPRSGRAVTLTAAVLSLAAAPPSLWVDAPRVAPGLASEAVRPVVGEVVEPFVPPPAPWGAGNRGVKLASQPNQPVRAAMDGTVSFAGTVADARWVAIDHGGGLVTTYGVVEPAVAAGQRVRAGQRVGDLAADRAVLHWGARAAGEYIDPLSLLGRWRVRLVSAGPAR